MVLKSHLDHDFWQLLGLYSSRGGPKPHKEGPGRLAESSTSFCESISSGGHTPSDEPAKGLPICRGH